MPDKWIPHKTITGMQKYMYVTQMVKQEYKIIFSSEI